MSPKWLPIPLGLLHLLVDLDLGLPIRKDETPGDALE